MISAAGDPHVVSITSLTDDQAHQVTDTELANGVTARTGRYRALCGHLVVAAAMVAPDGRPCAPCGTVLARHRVPARRRRLPGLLRQWFRPE